MPVQGSFQRDAHRCFWQGCRVRFWLRWLAWCLSLAVGVSVQLRCGQLLCPPGNRSAQTALAKVVRRLLIYSGWGIDSTGQDDPGLLSGCCQVVVTIVLQVPMSPEKPLSYWVLYTSIVFLSLKVMLRLAVYTVLCNP